MYGAGSYDYFFQHFNLKAMSPQTDAVNVDYTCKSYFLRKKPFKQTHPKCFTQSGKPVVDIQLLHVKAFHRTIIALQSSLL